MSEREQKFENINLDPIYRERKYTIKDAMKILGIEDGGSRANYQSIRNALIAGKIKGFHPAWAESKWLIPESEIPKLLNRAWRQEITEPNAGKNEA